MRSDRDRLPWLTWMMFILVWTCPCRACFNDTSAARAEDEFRSRYETPAPVEQPTPARYNAWGMVGLGLGVGLMGGAGVAGILRRRGES